MLINGSMKDLFDLKLLQQYFGTIEMDGCKELADFVSKCSISIHEADYGICIDYKYHTENDIVSYTSYINTYDISEEKSDNNLILIRNFYKFIRDNLKHLPFSEIKVLTDFPEDSGAETDEEMLEYMSKVLYVIT